MCLAHNRAERVRESERKRERESAHTQELGKRKAREHKRNQEVTQEEEEEEEDLVAGA